MNLMIGNEVYFNVQSFYTEYQKNNGSSHWVFITETNGHQYAVEYNPKKEGLMVKENIKNQ